MKKFSLHDLQRNTARVRDAALREPVTISDPGSNHVVLLSIAEFERLKRRDKTVIAIEGMPAEFILALRKPHFDPEQAALDRLLVE